MTRRGFAPKGRNISCVQCGTEFYAPVSWLDGGTRPRKYCAITCLRVAQGGSADPVEAFWLKVDKAGPGGCWLYRGALNTDGYGTVTRNRRMISAHRLAWQYTNGAIPDGLHLAHTCDVRACCNPSHLFLATHEENMRDMVRKGRHRNSPTRLLSPPI